MKRILMTWAIAIVGLTTAVAQTDAAGRAVTPFTPRVIDSSGRKVYVRPQRKQLPKMAITLGYGFRPAASLNGYMNDRFPFRHNNALNPDPNQRQGDITSAVGPIMVGFSYEFTPWLELNVPFFFQHNNGYQHFQPGEEDQSGSFKDDMVGVLPNVRINWVRNNWLSVYTRAGIGIGFGNRWVSVDQDGTGKAMFGYQLSPVGVELGTGRFTFFAEGGWGYMGAVSAGVKLKVGKVLNDGRTSQGRKVEWYEKYLH